MASAMILAAGLGTRLAPLTDFRAKALMPLGDKPLLEHLVLALRRAGIEKIAANAHHRADEVEAFAQENLPDVAISLERELLGTAGGVSHARALLGEGDVVIWNGDIVADLDVAALLAAQKKNAGAATLVVKPCAKGEGNVGLDAEGRVVRLRKETTREGEVAAGEFLGIHVLSAKLREALPEVGCLVGDVYLPALRRGGQIDAIHYARPFFDIGTPKAYLEANLAWLREQGRSHVALDTSSTAPGVDIVESIIGRNVKIEGIGVVSRSVVWSGSRIAPPIDGAVVTPHGTVHVTLGK